jgi:hypothetical protein
VRHFLSSRPGKINPERPEAVSTAIFSQEPFVVSRLNIREFVAATIILLIFQLIVVELHFKNGKRAMVTGLT